MALWENCSKFVRDTQNNLQITKELTTENTEFKTVTNLINSCLGLVVLPYELNRTDQLQNTQIKFSPQEEAYGTIYLLKRNQNKFPTLFEDVHYHMRNSICHGKILLVRENDEIKEIHFHDYSRPRKKGDPWKENFHMKLTPEQLIKFMEFVSANCGL